MGWSPRQIIDTSATTPYDFECREAGAPALRVEVKGTTTSGASVLLTRGEVDHAMFGEVPVALFVLAGVEVSTDQKGAPRAKGGELEYIEPWKPQSTQLRPETFTYWVRPPRP